MNDSSSSKFDHLALHGGAKSVSAEIPEWPPQWPNVLEALQRSWSDGSWGQYHGKTVQEFADAFAEYLGVKHVWPCSSGTVAVELALRGLGVTAAHEVILAGYDFPGNFRAIEAIGARPVLIDVRKNGFVLDESHLEAALTEKTKAVIATHLHGQLANIEEIQRRLQTRGIGLLEDACQVPGARVASRPAGTLGDIGTFSFGGSKLMTCGRGGAIVTDCDASLQRIRIAAERGNDAFPLSALQAAALIPQLETLEDLHARRLQAAKRLRDAMQGFRVFRPLEDAWSDSYSPAFFKFAVQIPAHHDREFLLQALRAEGAPVFTGFRGFGKRSKRRCDQVGTLANAAVAAQNTLLLHHPFLLGDESLVDQIGGAFQKIDTCF